MKRKNDLTEACFYWPYESKYALENKWILTACLKLLRLGR